MIMTSTRPERRRQARAALKRDKWAFKPKQIAGRRRAAKRAAKAAAQKAAS